MIPSLGVSTGLWFQYLLQGKDKNEVSPNPAVPMVRVRGRRSASHPRLSPLCFPLPPLFPRQQRDLFVWASHPKRNLSSHPTFSTVGASVYTRWLGKPRRRVYISMFLELAFRQVGSHRIFFSTGPRDYSDSAHDRDYLSQFTKLRGSATVSETATLLWIQEQRSVRWRRSCGFRKEAQ